MLFGYLPDCMAERDRQIGGEVDTDPDIDDLDIDVPDESLQDVSESTRESDAARSEKVRTRIRKGAGKVLSARSLLLSVVLTVAGVIFIGGLLPLGMIGDLIGVLVAGFLYGIVAQSRRYVETALAGGAVGGGSALLGNLVLSVVGPGVPLVLFGVVAGALAGSLGHYFGRDLRDGLTREI